MMLAYEGAMSGSSLAYTEGMHESFWNTSSCCGVVQHGRRYPQLELVHECPQGTRLGSDHWVRWRENVLCTAWGGSCRPGWFDHS